MTVPENRFVIKNEIKYGSLEETLIEFVVVD